MASSRTCSRRIVVGITGASGALYAQRLIHLLMDAEVETHLVVSPLGQRLLHDELGMQGIDLADLSRGRTGQLIHHPYRDVGAAIASGSFRHDGMIVIPCSSNTLSAVAHGAAANLLHRAAHVTLKERWPLVLVHRESPLSLVDIRNMQAAAEAGAVIAPASPGFYMLPDTISDLVDFVVGRCLDLLDVPHQLDVRWKAKPGDGS